MVEMHKNLAHWEVKHNGQQSFSLAFEPTIDMLMHTRLIKKKKGLSHQTVAVKSRNTEDKRQQIA